MFFLDLRWDSRVTTGITGFPLLALGSPVLHSSGEGKLGAALSHCRAKETSSRRVSRMEDSVFFWLILDAFH